MNIRLQIVDHQSHALPAGLEFTLLANGQEVAKATSDAEGTVSFDFDSEVKEGLSVRLDGWPAAREAADRVMKPSET